MKNIENKIYKMALKKFEKSETWKNLEGEKNSSLRKSLQKQYAEWVVERYNSYSRDNIEFTEKLLGGKIEWQE